jgi:hypothetical protein
VSKKHHFKNAHVQRKPDRPVTNRVQQRYAPPKQRVVSKARIVRRDIPDARRGRRVETSRVRSPNTEGSLARSNRVDKRVPRTVSKKTEHRKTPRVSTQTRLDARNDRQIIRTSRPVKPARRELDTRKEMQTVRTGRPVKPARRQEVRAEKQRRTVPKVQRNARSQPSNRQVAKVENRRQAAKSTTQKSKGESRVVQRNKPSSKAQVSNDSTATGQHTMLKLQPQKAQPRHQKNARSPKRERNSRRRSF